jgi:hypothetical protein
LSLLRWLHRQWLRFIIWAPAKTTLESDCECKPLLIPHGEFIARALFYSFHVDKNGKLNWKAFQPDRGESDLSVMRTGCLAASECKKHVAMMERQGEYKGFALLHTGQIRGIDLDVVDSRKVFCGHADLLLGAQRPLTDGDPADPLDVQKLRALARKLIALSTTRLDSQPTDIAWHESDLWVPAVLPQSTADVTQNSIRL